MNSICNSIDITFHYILVIVKDFQFEFKITLILNFKIIQKGLVSILYLH